MKKAIFFLFILSSATVFADSTMTVPGKNQLYMNIPNVLGYERQLPFQLYVGIRGIIKLDLQAEGNEILFNQVNAFNVYVYREFYGSIASVAPLFGIALDSEEDVANEPFNTLFVGLQLYHRFLLANRYEITPNMRVLHIQGAGGGVIARSFLFPELQIGVHF